MKSRNLSILVSLLLCLIILSCSWDLEDNTNINIPTYNHVFTDDVIKEDNLVAPIYNASDEGYITAYCSELNEIVIIGIKNSLIDNNWELTRSILKKIPATRLYDFRPVGENYLLVYEDVDNKLFIEIHDKTFMTVKSTITDIKSYIDTTYNEITSFNINNIDVNPSKTILYLSGSVESFGNKFSCVLALEIGQTLKYSWFKTYTKKGEIISLKSAKEKFAVIEVVQGNFALIIDNEDFSAYRKTNLRSSDEISNKMQVLNIDSTNVITVFNERVNGIVSINNLNYSTNTLFENDVKLYQCSKALAMSSSRNSLFVMGNINFDTIQNALFISETSINGSNIWCNTFEDLSSNQVLSFTEDKNLGLIMSYVYSNQGKNYLAIIRMDEEGATLENPYDLNCN